MRISEYHRDMSISFTFRGHEFNLERDAYHDNIWYIQVSVVDGSNAYDGWWNDSQDKTMREAILQACDSAMIEPPKRWPNVVLD